MPERYLRKADIAAMFSMRWDMAASILRENGVCPVDFGVGSGRGLRWLESAVNAVMRQLHAMAQAKAENSRPEPGNRKQQPSKTKIDFANMDNKEIYGIVSRHPIQ